MFGLYFTESECADEIKPASNAEGAKFTPRFNMPWKNFLKASILLNLRFRLQKKHSLK
jgi:hypothetical protein